MSQSPSLPPVILGDHGFMRLYGSRLSDAEIEARMDRALAAGIPMLSAGDARLPAIVARAFARQGRRPSWVKHLDAPLCLDGAPLPFDRAMSTLRAAGLEHLGERLVSDPIMGPFLNQHATAEPLAREEIARLHLDYVELGARLDIIKKRAPAVVTVGGDATDFLLAANRADIFAGLLDHVSAAVTTVAGVMYASSYLGAVWPDRFESIVSRADVAGLMMPANTGGAGMLPDANRLRGFWRQCGKPVLAMHVLAIGILPLEEALPAVLGWPEVGAAVIGAANPDHIDALAKALRTLAVAPQGAQL